MQVVSTVKNGTSATADLNALTQGTNAVAQPMTVPVASVVKSGIYVEDYLDGATPQTYAAPSADLRALAARFAVGNTANFSDNGFHGQIAEILIYNRALSDAERAQVEAELIAKYY